ncbi:hypothetical protein HHK36_002442 [Tetracentron sinense]|uniref:Protein kinase domain-containing protein n=1 Tax=Tetracentron sinense TaxID=13715 RepID=A0A835DMU9_TETSI|nr:hypothetical protein HHK36_002442 [Tetracentron sinense]
MAESGVSGREPINLYPVNPADNNGSGTHGHVQEGDAGGIKIPAALLIDLNHISIGSIISEGRHSIFYQGLYKTMSVAIKVIQPDKTSAVSPEGKDKFRREVIMLSKIKHENFVTFIGASIEPTMMIVTELLRGGSLQKYLWDIRPSCPDLQLSISFALDISRVMAHLHANGIIHRNLKPRNLLLTEDQKKLKLANFRLAREVEKMTTEAGTYRYMAPEMYSPDTLQCAGKKHYDHKVDVYSFSMVLWELLTNCMPFKGRNNIQIVYAVAKKVRPSVDNLPKDIGILLQSCWAEDPASRPEFMVITNSLSNFLDTLRSQQITPPQVFGIEQEKKSVASDSAGTHHLMEKCGEMEGMKSRSSTPRFLSCFDDCFSNDEPKMV